MKHSKCEAVSSGCLPILVVEIIVFDFNSRFLNLRVFACGRVFLHTSTSGVHGRLDILTRRTFVTRLCLRIGDGKVICVAIRLSSLADLDQTLRDGTGSWPIRSIG